MKIRAIFIGRNGSLGYETGKEYDLQLAQTPEGGSIIGRYSDHSGRCEYESLFALLNNWTMIRSI